MDAGTLKHFPGANDTAAVCNAARTFRCGLSGTNTAKCFCRSGWTGPTCEEMVDVLEYSLVLGGFLLPLAFFALSVWLVRRYDARTGNKAWSFAPQALTDGVAGKHGLLVYRASSSSWQPRRCCATSSTGVIPHRASSSSPSGH